MARLYTFDSLTLKNVVISGNTAGVGRWRGRSTGIKGPGAGIKVNISNSLITDNSATNGNDGGLDLQNLKSLTISTYGDKRQYRLRQPVAAAFPGASNRRAAASPLPVH